MAGNSAEYCDTLPHPCIVNVVPHEHESRPVTKGMFDAERTMLCAAPKHSSRRGLKSEASVTWQAHPHALCQAHRRRRRFLLRRLRAGSKTLWVRLTSDLKRKTDT